MALTGPHVDWLHVYTRYNPFAHPSCTSLFILLFIKSQYTVFCTSYLFCTFLFYCTFYSLFIFFTYIYIYAPVLCYFHLTFIFLFFLHCPLSGPDLIYISLLIIPCIIYYVTNKQTLTLFPRYEYN